jgi:hypothetical protein
MKETNCYNCGIRIWFDDDYYNTLVFTHKSFYCPNGHSQSFVGKTKDQLIIDGLKESMNRYITQKDKELFEKNREIIRLKENTFYCAKCYKFFTSKNNLNRHNNKIHENDKSKRCKK